MTPARRRVLLAAVLAASAAGLVYELAAGAVAGYLEGSSVTAYSLVVGVFLTAMGVGSWLSRFVTRFAADTLVAVEIALSIGGALLTPALFWGFALFDSNMPVLVGGVGGLGVLVGMEIPLVLRLLVRSRGDDGGPGLRAGSADVLAADYAGALAASIAFPFVLLPEAGLVQSGVIAAALNLGAAGLALWALAERVVQPRALAAGIAVAFGVLVALAWRGEHFVRGAEALLYQDEVIYTAQTPYQRIVVTRRADDLRLYLNGGLQFSTIDAYRYHEALVHPGATAAGRVRRALVLGGGDGFAARELLRLPGIEGVDVVDLDPAVTTLFRTNALLAGASGRALNDPRVTVHNADAFVWLRDAPRAPHRIYDLIVADLPDPDAPELAKLYSVEFIEAALARLRTGGVFVTQAGSPFFSRGAFSVIAATAEAARHPAGTRVTAYAEDVPSFGPWGFVLVQIGPAGPRAAPPPGLLRLTPRLIAAMLAGNLGADDREPDAPPSRLVAPTVVQRYQRDQQRFR